MKIISTYSARAALVALAAATVCGTIALAAAPGPTLGPLSVNVPSPGGYFQGTGAEILNQHCVTCHSAGFVERQPKLSASTWTVEVTKMKKAFGAPYAEADIPKSVDALVARQKAMK